MKQHAPYYQKLLIDEKVFIKNIKTLQAYSKKPLGVVVKGHAYGHDLGTAARLFIKAGVKRFICYHLSDALSLRAEYPKLSILLIGPICRDDLKVCRNHNIELTIWDLSFLKVIRSEPIPTALRDKKLKVHIEIETGMHRTGVQPELMASSARELFSDSTFQCVGFSTHLSGADEQENLDRVQAQVQRFQGFRSHIEKTYPSLKGKLQWHGPNSAGLMIKDSRVFTHARVGILAYGFFPSAFARDRWPSASFPRPTPALKWISRIAGWQEIPAGKYTGYGKTHKTRDTVRSVMIPTGYGDGLPRSFSNRWKVKIGKRYRPIIGRVNMNQIIVDVTGLPIREKDAAVTLISPTGPYDWYKAADLSKRFIYELLTGISPKIERQIS